MRPIGSHTRRGLPPCAIALVLASVCVGGGCGGGSSSADRFVPAATDAEAALTAALAAWKSGAPAGPVADSSPLIHVTDSYRRKGERLVGFRILGETPGDVPRCYAVELQFDPARTEKTRYVIVGIDPLWVFRMEDYQLLAHWEHRMDEGASGPGGEQTLTPALGERNDEP